MVWVRLDDQFSSDPKVLEAGPLGMAMQVAALCYCNRHLTDGLLPRPAAAALMSFEGLGMRVWQGEFAGGGEDASWELVVADLVEAGMWHEPGHDCDECPQFRSGYYLHGYLDYQPSREQVKADQEQKRTAGKKGGKASAQARAQAGASPRAQADGAAKRQAAAQAKSKPVPGPVPVPLEDLEPSADADDGFETFWEAFPRGRGGKPGGDGPKKPARQKWARLTDEQRAMCLVAVEHYRAYIESPGSPYAAHATTWLNQERWEQWQEPAVETSSDPPHLSNVHQLTAGEGGKW